MSLNVQRVKIVQDRTRRTLVAGQWCSTTSTVGSGASHPVDLETHFRVQLALVSAALRRGFREMTKPQDVHNCFSRIEQLLMGSDTCATLCLCRPLSEGATGERVHKTLRSCSVRLCKTRFVGSHVVPTPWMYGAWSRTLLPTHRLPHHVPLGS